MTILVDARPLLERRPGGVTRVAAGLLPALVEAMPQERFVFATTGTHNPSLAHGKHLRIPNKLWSALSFFRLVSFNRAFADEKPDLLLLPNIGFIGTPTVPYALIVHDLSFLIEPTWFSWKSRLWHHAVRAKTLIKNAAYLFAVSETTKRDLINLLHTPAERITVIPLATSATRDGRDLPLPPTLQGKRFVLALGGNDPRKNAGCAERAIEALRKNPTFADVQLITIGRDITRPSDDELASLMKHSSAFLYPSWYEGFGLPLHEAARFGTPCVASTAGALPETAPHGTLFAPPSKPHLWTTALETILTQPNQFRTQTKNVAWSVAAEMIKRELQKPEPPAVPLVKGDTRVNGSFSP